MTAGGGSLRGSLWAPAARGSLRGSLLWVTSHACVGHFGAATRIYFSMGDADSDFFPVHQRNILEAGRAGIYRDLRYRPLQAPDKSTT